MAKLKTVVNLGQSNHEGLAPFSEVDAATWYRYTGDSSKFGGAADLTNYQKVINGINIWTPRMPCPKTVTASGTASAGSTVITLAASSIVSAKYGGPTQTGPIPRVRCITGANAGYEFQVFQSTDASITTITAANLVVTALPAPTNTTFSFTPSNDLHWPGTAFSGHTITFDAGTTTALLQGKSYTLLANTGPLLITNTPMAAVPVAGDIFKISGVWPFAIAVGDTFALIMRVIAMPGSTNTQLNLLPNSVRASPNDDWKNKWVIGLAGGLTGIARFCSGSGSVTTPSGYNPATFYQGLNVDAAYSSAIADITNRVATGGTIGAAGVPATATTAATLVAGQWSGGRIRFNDDTSTALLRGKSYAIYNNTTSTITTLTDMAAAPANGDYFSLSAGALATQAVTATGGSTTTIVAGAGTFSTSGTGLAGYLVTFASETTTAGLRGKTYSVFSNTDTTLTMAEVLGAACANTDTFILSPCDVIYITEDGTQGADTDFATSANPNFSYEGKFLPLQFSYKTLGSYIYYTGYDYPNFHGTPLPTPSQHLNLFGDRTGCTSPMLEIWWGMRLEYDGDLWVVEMPIPYSYLSVQKGPLLANLDFSWFRSARTNDWNPSSTEFRGALTEATVNPCFYDLYGLLVDFIIKQQAQAWLTTNRPNDQLDIQSMFLTLGEAESLDYLSTPSRASIAGRNMVTLRETMRKAIGDGANGVSLTTLTPSKIPWVMANMHHNYAGYVVVNPQYDQLPIDDTYTGLVDTTSYTPRASDPLHFNGQSYVSIGADFVTKWRAIKTRDADATTSFRRRLTLADLRTEVNARYTGNSVSTDNASGRIDRAINDAQREIINRLGHSAWFLRRTETMTFTCNQYTPFTMPGMVGDIIQIRDSTQPDYEYKFSMVSRTSEGRCRIVMPMGTATPQSLEVDFIEQQRDMIGDGDYTLIPYEYMELLVVLAVRRLAERGGNAMMVQLMNAAAGAPNGSDGGLWAGIWRKANAAERAKNSAFHTETQNNVYRAWVMGRDGPAFFW